MAVRIRNAGELSFGRWGAQTVATHGRVSVGSDELGTVALENPITVRANGSAEIGANTISLLLPSNSDQADGFQDAGYRALLALALNGRNPLRVDLMTDANTVVSAAGYTQDSTPRWTLTVESDS